MKVLDLTLPTPAENLACDETLLGVCEEGLDEEVLRFWDPPEHFVVLGYANQSASEVNLDACRTAGIPVLRRCSGGGTVLQGPGCLNYALILRAEGEMASITATNQAIMSRHRGALAGALHQPVEVQGITDLTMGGRKFSGNSQRRRRRFLLFHGTFLLDYDIALIERLLPNPARQPPYRQHRAHTDFLVNLGVEARVVKRALSECWQAAEPFSVNLREKVERLAGVKYSQAEWTLKF